MDHALRSVFLPAARWIDRATAAIGRLAAWLVLAACLVSIFNSLMRYGAHFAAQALIDLPPLFFAGIVLGTAPKALRENSDILVDILFRSLGPRKRAVIDIIGNLAFLMPLCAVMVALGVPGLATSWRIGEGPLTPGGLPPWPARALIPMAFALLLLQAVSELVKSIAALRGIASPPQPTDPTELDAAASALRSSGAP